MDGTVTLWALLVGFLEFTNGLSLVVLCRFSDNAEGPFCLTLIARL